VCDALAIFEGCIGCDWIHTVRLQAALNFQGVPPSIGGIKPGEGLLSNKRAALRT
jgi:hypothetical protein